jgi:hypothetical protein
MSANRLRLAVSLVQKRRVDGVKWMPFNRPPELTGSGGAITRNQSGLHNGLLHAQCTERLKIETSCFLPQAPFRRDEAVTRDLACWSSHPPPWAL